MTLRDGLEAEYHFSGDATDSSGNGNDATINGATFTTDKNGVSNQALSFDGVNDYVNKSPFGINMGSSCSFGAWINSNSLSNFQMIMSNHTNSSNRNGYLRLNTDGRLYLSDYAISNGLFSISSLTTGTWYHIFITMDSNSTKIFINGNLDAEVTGLTRSSYKNLVWDIGRNAQFGQYFNGKIDEVKIYDRALTEYEVLQLYYGYDSEADSVDTLNEGLVYGSHFDNGTATDWSGNGNNGTVVGATATTDKNSVSNQALSFDGSGDYVDTGLTNAVLGGHFSISLWAKPSVFENGNALISGDSGISSRGWTLQQSGTSGNLGFSVSDDGTNIDAGITTTNPLSTSNFVHITAVYEQGQRLKLYINGNQETLSRSGTLQTSAVNNNGNNIRIGDNQFDTQSLRFFQGVIDEPRIFNRALTDYEIFQLYTAYDSEAGTVDTLKQNLLGYWDLDSDTLDKSGNGNDMTASGGSSNTSTGGPGNTGYYSTTSVSQLIEGSFTEDLSKDITTVQWNYSLGTGVGPYPMCAYFNTGGTSFEIVGGSVSYLNDQLSVGAAITSTGGFASTSKFSNTPSVWNFNVVRVDSVNNTVGLSQNNGTKTSSVAFSGSPKNNEIFFGTAGATNRWFNGRFSKVAIWNRKLFTEEEIQLYNSGNGLLYSELETPVSGSVNKTVQMLLSKP